MIKEERIGAFVSLVVWHAAITFVKHLFSHFLFSEVFLFPLSFRSPKTVSRLSWNSASWNCRCTMRRNRVFWLELLANSEQHLFATSRSTNLRLHSLAKRTLHICISATRRSCAHMTGSLTACLIQTTWSLHLFLRNILVLLVRLGAMLRTKFKILFLL